MGNGPSSGRNAQKKYKTNRESQRTTEIFGGKKESKRTAGGEIVMGKERKTWGRWGDKIDKVSRWSLELPFTRNVRKERMTGGQGKNRSPYKGEDSTGDTKKNQNKKNQIM